MKSLLGALLLVYVGLLSHPAWSATVYHPTDGDVDFLVFQGGLNPGQFLALTRPDELPGAFWSLNITNVLDHHEILATDLVTSVLGTPNFSVVLWDSIDWHFANIETLTNGDGALLEWTFDHGVDKHRSIKMLAVDVQAVPIPAAAWLFGSGLLGMMGVGRGVFS
jgi:hypothetical protein